MGALHAQASVVIAGTRVIYNAKDAETTIKLTNEGRSPRDAGVDRQGRRQGFTHFH